MAENGNHTHDFGDKVCAEIALAALDRFLESLAAEAQGSPHLSLEDIRAAADRFKAEYNDELRHRFRDFLEASLRELEKDLWDQTRRRPFDRLLVKRFSSLFPVEGGLKARDRGLSRRVLPGLFMALEMMEGTELYEQCQVACKTILKEGKPKDGGRYRWEKLYTSEQAMELVDDILAVMAIHFEDFPKRVQWLLDLINSHLAPAEDYEFEGEAVHEWTLDEPRLVELLRALFSSFATRMANEEGRRQVVERCGDRGGKAIENMLKALDEAD